MATTHEAHATVASRFDADGSVMYAGHRYTGAQATYVAQAMGARVAQVAGTPLDGHTIAERKAILAYRLARDGIPYHVWTRWTIDQMALYFEGRKLAGEMVERTTQAIRSRYDAVKADSPVRYVVPLE
jgi:hypothetical protein